MRLVVKCYATLMPFTPEGGALEGFSGATVLDLLLHLGLNPEDVKIVFVNGVSVETDAPLHDGDRVGIFPAVGGG